MRSINAALLAGLFLAATTAGVTAGSEQTDIPAYISAAVADTDRPQSDRVRDEFRKPAAVVAFAGIKPGDRIGELMPGRGYFTQIFCRVVGESGHIYAVLLTPSEPPRGPPPADAPVAAAPPAAKSCTNISTESQTTAALKLPASLDLVWTSENYHDLHNKMFGPADMRAFDKVVFNALKPGGIFIVEDHAAAAGSGANDTETLHRIDPEWVKKEVTAVGFVLIAQSNALRNPDDPHTAKVFELKGKSDKFLFKFQKPLH